MSDVKRPFQAVETRRRPMKKTSPVILLIICAMMLSGCGAKDGTTAEKDTAQGTQEAQEAQENQEKQETQATEEDKTEEIQEANETGYISSDDKEKLYAGYMDVSQLPVMDFDLKREYICDDRTLIMEDSVDNTLEYVVYKRYYDIVSADFEGLMKNIGGSSAFKIANKNEEKNFSKGMYMTEYDIYALSTLTLDDIKAAGDGTAERLFADVKECGLNSYAVVAADLSWKYNEASKEAAPQLEEGRYTRYYLLGSTDSDSEIKICQVYWEDFL